MARLDLDTDWHSETPDNGNETGQPDFKGLHLREKMRHAPVDVDEVPNRFRDYDGATGRDMGPSEGKEPKLDMLELAESFVRNSNEEFLAFSERVEGNQNAIDRMIYSIDEEVETLATRLNELQSKRDVLSRRLNELHRVRESGQKVRETLHAALYSDKEQVVRDSLLNPNTGHPNDANLAKAYRTLSDNPQG